MLMCVFVGFDVLWDEFVMWLDVQFGEVMLDGCFSVQKVECFGSCGIVFVFQFNDEGFYECVGLVWFVELLVVFQVDQKFVIDYLVFVLVGVDGW